MPRNFLVLLTPFICLHFRNPTVAVVTLSKREGGAVKERFKQGSVNVKIKRRLLRAEEVSQNLLCKWGGGRAIKGELGERRKRHAKSVGSTRR